MCAETTPSRRSISLPDGAVSYLEWSAPAGARTLIFLHANGFHGGVYRQLLEPLAGEVRILALDLRGHGGTTLPADPTTLESWLVYRDDVVAFLDAMETGPVWMAGHSLGGVVSALLAVYAPDRVRGLVLADPVFLPRWILAMIDVLGLVGQGWRVGPAGPARRRRDGWPNRAAARAHYDGRGMFRGWPEGWLDDYLVEGLRDRDDGTVGLACSSSWESRSFALVPRDTWRFVRGILCPTTIVHGEDSDTFRQASARLAPKRIPGVRMVPVPGASHFVPMEHPEIVRAEIQRMIKLSL